MDTQTIKIKQCIRCKRTLPLTKFYRNKQSKDGRTARCGDCLREYNKGNKTFKEEKESDFGAWMGTNAGIYF